MAQAVRVATVLALLALAVTGCHRMAGTAMTKEPMRAVSELIPPSEQAGQFLTAKHFVTHWLVLGPFQFAEGDFGGDQQQAAADKEFMPDEGALDGTQPAPQGASWKEKDFKGDFQAGRVDLDGFYGTPDHAAAYAVAWLHCPEAIPNARLLVGSDDYIKVWINGKLVHAYKEKRRASEWDQDKIENVALQRGYNRVVVKCVDVVVDWDFYFRLADKDGRPITVKAAAPGK